MDNSDIFYTLLTKIANGSISSEKSLSAIKSFAVQMKKSELTDSELIESLSSRIGASSKELIEELSSEMLEYALQYHECLKRNETIPAELQTALKDYPVELIGKNQKSETSDIIPRLNGYLQIIRDYIFLRTRLGGYSPIPEKLREALFNEIRSNENARSYLAVFTDDKIAKIQTFIPGECPAMLPLQNQFLRHLENSTTAKRRQILSIWGSNPYNLIGASIDESVALRMLINRFKSSDSEKERNAVLDVICSFLSYENAGDMENLNLTTAQQLRASIIFSLRFGRPSERVMPSWLEWMTWISKSLSSDENIVELRDYISKHHGLIALLWLWIVRADEMNLSDALIQWVGEGTEQITPSDIVQRYPQLFSDKEKTIIITGQNRSGLGKTSADNNREDEVPVHTPEVPHVSQPAAMKQETVLTPEASLWNNHVRPFVTENWYLIAGIFMVIAGSSLLAFYTWDKHWLVPYTIMPLLLGAFTAGLAGIGSWVEKRGSEFLNMAAMLRGAAIALLPVNFMTVALLSNDASVSHKIPAVLLMSAFYLFIGGWGLKRWCGAMHPSIGKLLGFTLLAINFLVFLAPLSKELNGITGSVLNFILGVGFYSGFLISGAVLLFFTRNIMTEEMAREKRIPCFFTLCLLVTFIQVFAWVHGFAGCLPHVFTYAPMLIATGGLLMIFDRYSLKLKNAASEYSTVSFIAFGVILLGIVMGIANDFMRIFCLFLAGVLWMSEANIRKQAAHYWISLALIALGCMSVALLKPSAMIWLPVGKWFPVSIIAAALLMEIFIAAGKMYKNELLNTVAKEMQTVIFAIAAISAVLAQLHYSSEPRITALYLLLTTAAFLRRALEDNRLRWLHTAMLIMALSLPYLGCLDILNRTMKNNTMVFGMASLSLLWLAALWTTKHQLLIKARSTVLLFYGILALVAMLLRVFIRDQAAPNVLMDYSGPLIITAVMVLAAYYSRSLIPAGIGAVIFIILFPELKSYFQKEFESSGWGSGLGSSISAFLLICSCFILRKAAFLKELKDGDLFLGRYQFPMKRFDHTLFTWPLLLSALFMLMKADFIIVPGNLFRNGLQQLPLQSSLALMVSGAAWASLCIYYRRHRAATVMIYLGLICFLSGFSMIYYRFAEEPHYSRILLYCGLAVQGLYFMSRYLTSLKWPEISTLFHSSFRAVLNIGSLLLTLICSYCLFSHVCTPYYLMGFSAFIIAQLLWHGLSSRRIIHGIFLFFFIWLNATAWYCQAVPEYITSHQALIPGLWYLLCIMLVHFALELRISLHRILEPLLNPMLFLASFFVTFLGIAEIVNSFAFSFRIDIYEQCLLLAVVFATARVHANTMLAFLGFLLFYIFTCGWERASETARLFFSPLRLSSFALLLALCGAAWKMFRSSMPRITAGPFGQKFFKADNAIWFFIPAIFSATAAASHQTFDPALASSRIESIAPRISAVATLLVAFFWEIGILYYLAIVFLSLADIHTVRIYLEGPLTNLGLSQNHLLCIGLALTMLITTGIKHSIKRETPSKVINHACLIMAAIILTLLTVTYVASPDLSHITWFRFAVSGVISLLAGLYFRNAARYPGPGEERTVEICEGIYHYSISVTIWCAALLIPWFRTPYTALYALALPSLYFYSQAALRKDKEPLIARRFVNSATVLSFIILFIYLFRFAIQMTMFPDCRIDLMHYHYCAPAVLLISLVMLRLHAIGGSYWTALYGGIGLMSALYFIVSWLPYMSPFRYPANGAFCAVVVGHLWILFSYPDYITSSLFRRFAELNDSQWASLRRCWGWFLLAGTHAAVVWGLFDLQHNTYMAAPLLAAASTVLLHLGNIKKTLFYFIFAAIELTIALHADFLIPSYIPGAYVIWVILGLWVLTLAAAEIIKRTQNFRFPAGLYAIFFLMVSGHIAYHGFNSTVGLAAFAISVILALLTPVADRNAHKLVALLPAALPVWAPTWLVFFIHAHGKASTEWVSTFSLLITALALLVTGLSARYYKLQAGEKYEQLPRLNPRLFDITLNWLNQTGFKINLAMLATVFLFLTLLTLMQWSAPAFPVENFTLILILYIVSSIAWCMEGLRLQHMLPFFLMEICGMGAWFHTRIQIIKSVPDFWRAEYDLWSSIFAAGLICALLQLPKFRVKQIRIPLTFMFCFMPLSALSLTLINHMGSNFLLLVVAVYSTIFIFMGRDRRESPYHIAAVGGFTAFLIIILWNKLEVHTLHAFTVPAGAGVLFLLHLFRKQVQTEICNQIRMVTLLLMLGSTGYYALMGSTLNICYILVFGLLALAVMISGTIFRIRIYMAFGCCGLIVAVAVAFCKLVLSMQRSTQMTIIGSLILLSGVSIVAGAIFYKTNKGEIMRFLNVQRCKFRKWE